MSSLRACRSATLVFAMALMATSALTRPAVAQAQAPIAPIPVAPAPAAPAPTAILPVPGPAPAAAPGGAAASDLQPGQAAVVRDIVIQGNERIEASTVASYLPIARGDRVDSAVLDTALKALGRTELFADVQLEMQGATLVVRVVENPIINQVVFEGNRALNDEKLRDEVTIHPRSIFTRAHVQADVQRIVELYRRSGRISASVTAEIVELPQKRVDLIFKMDEGAKTGIDHINFLGNKAFSDNNLRDAIVTTDTHWYKFFTSNDNYDPDRIEYDREQLRKYYTNKGYYDFRVVSSIAELTNDQKRFLVTFTIDEGEKYRFGKLDVTTGDVRRLNGEVLRQLLPIKEGQIYQADRIEAAVDALTFAAGSAGFAFVDIRPRYTPNRETHTIDVSFDVREGQRVYLDRIDIVGNTRTIDQVIRRELRIAEGDAYNRVLVDRSVTEIKRLNFFKTVEIEQVPTGAPDRTNLRVKVEEQPTGELSFGAGYSSVDKLLLDIGISEHNFRGRGQDVRLRASVGSLRQQIDASYTEPRFLGRDLRGGLNAYSYRYDFQDQAGFQTKSLGVGATVGWPMTISTYFQGRYTIHTDSVVVDGASCDAGLISITICDQRGNSLTSQLGYTLSMDKRNDPIKPTRGFFATVGQDFAGVGGNVQFVKSDFQGSWYYGITSGIILQANGSAGYIFGWGGDSVRINDRYFKGGNTFRGFETAGIGPRDTAYQEALGGKAYAIGSFELNFPNLLPEQYGIKTALFTEFGTLGLLDKSAKLSPTVQDNLGFRASAGISVFWNAPVGPIRLDFSKILRKEAYDRTEGFRFSTSTQF
ncbi:MAG TPA: outer membrane protein assembly factor BamA [Caulobacteraceae bacterium]|nr:outer membrane protein assembly factor BamA [Caulobacteraceae bacterium]